MYLGLLMKRLIYFLCCPLLCLEVPYIYANNKPGKRSLRCEGTLSSGNTDNQLGAKANTAGNQASPVKLQIGRGKRRAGNRSSVEIYRIQTEIMSLMEVESHITIPKIADRLEETEVTINQMTRKLREKGLIGRRGSKKTGKWIVFGREGSSFVYDFQEEQDRDVLLLMAKNLFKSGSKLFGKMQVSHATINKIIARLRAKGWLDPTHFSKFGYWKLTEVGYHILSSEYGIEPVINDPKEQQNQEIMSLMIADPYIKRSQIAEKMEMEVSIGMVASKIKKLKEEGRVERIGSSKSGKWRVRRREKESSSLHPREEKEETE